MTRYRNRTTAKLAEQHTLPTPAWSAPDIPPNDWIKQTIEPLLTGIPVRVEPRREFPHTRRTQEPPPEKAFKAIGDIMVFDGTGHAYDHDRISFLLYWVGEMRHVAVSPYQLGRGNFYAYELSDLRYLADAEDLRQFVVVLCDKARQLAFQKQKREKIKTLKRQAIVAQLRQIAQEERFAFYVETTALLIRVGVRLDDNNQLVIAIPFGEFESILPRVREAVTSLRALHQHKIRFKTTLIGYRKEWIMPDPAPST